MDPDELLCESVEPGGEIHNAICAVQRFYAGKLPAPVARNTWRELQRVCRHETDLYKRQNEAHRYAGNLKDWAHGEIQKDKPEPPTVALTPEEKTILETLANESGMTVTQEALAGQTRLSDKTVRKWVGKLRERGFVNQPRGPKKGLSQQPPAWQLSAASSGRILTGFLPDRFLFPL